MITAIMMSSMMSYTPHDITQDPEYKAWIECINTRHEQVQPEGTYFSTDTTTDIRKVVVYTPPNPCPLPEKYRK